MAALIATVIIPTYQHGAVVSEAIDCALAQTVPCEVIVVDDGSTDRTSEVLARYDHQIRTIRMAHQGPCAARNAGLDAATGEFVMFLDADDLMVPTKVEVQLSEFAREPDAGWVLCDVQIDDEAKNRVETASQKYWYAEKDLSGWIQPQLIAGNFIPIMSPLIRRELLEGIRFQDEKVPEDWHFWYAVAGVGRVRYVPEILATYRHRRQGRSRLPKPSRLVQPSIEEPLRLNLGCGTPNTRSWHPMRGFVNLDKSLGWQFEDGLGDFLDHSVHGISISHSLMYVPIEQWSAVFSEFARVLAEDGVVRITEDETEDPQSSRGGGWKGSQPAVTLTTPALVKGYLERAGLAAYDVARDTSRYRDGSLCQAQHGDPPDVFFVEGQKLRGTLFAPHSDDESLFASFTILRYRPRVVICYPSARDYGETSVREQETRSAMSVLGGQMVEQWDGRDIEAQMRAFEARVHPVRVWAPDRQASHPDHVAVAVAAAAVFGDRVTTYHTYEGGTKVRSHHEVPFEPVWLGHKLRALARYETQLQHPRGYWVFAEDMREYYGEVRL